MTFKFINLLITLFGIFLAFLLVELSLNIVQFLGERYIFKLKPVSTTLEWQNHPSLGKFILKPNQTGWFITPSGEYQTFIKTNSEGFYDISHLITKPKNTYRMILLGDSFVANLQSPLEQTIGKQIEKKLNKKNLGKKIEVISIGLGDTGSAQQLQALKEIGLKYNPDLVIHFFLTANDIKNNSLNLQFDPYRDYYMLENGELKLISGKIREKNLFKDQIKKLKTVEKALYLRQVYFETKSLNKFPIDYQVYQTSFDSEYQKAWEVTKKLILVTKKQSEQSNAKYLLVTLANNEQVNLDIWQGISTKYPALDSSGINLENPDNLVKDFCISFNITCIHLLSAFKNYVQKTQTSTHFKYDGHWNTEGIELAASAITEFLFNNDYFSTK